MRTPVVPRTAVVTLAHGRHRHLARQAASLTRSLVPPDYYVVVAMDDAAIDAVVPGAQVVHVPRVDGHLPLAAARNAGVAHATERGAELVILLDVDCVVEPALVGRYVEVAGEHTGVLCGAVGYLPALQELPTDLRAVATPHPARPVPADDEVLPVDDANLFWSLSFAMPVATWDCVGGFCEDYVGYGGEDTDFARLLVAAEVPLWWVGGAWAFHQHHGAGGPPTDHLHDIVRNARVFHDRWGSWPMSGWLEDFARRGLVARDADDRWAVVG